MTLSNKTSMPKLLYVVGMRGVSILAKSIGLLTMLDRRREKRVYHWLRSLFAIHDLDAMVDLDVPWWTYGAIDAVERLLAAQPETRVFEYGSGASTVWLARRAKQVTSVEHDPHWYAVVSKRIADISCADVRLIEPDDPPDLTSIYRSSKLGHTNHSFCAYVNAIEEAGGPFDLIVIDGRSRAACIKHALDHLTPGGVIVFDNSNRAEYRTEISAFRGRSSQFRGLAPALPYPDETSLLFYDDEAQCVS